MTARTDLDNAFSILDAGINAHVTALKSARDTAAAAQAVANDDTYLKELTSKVLSFADVLNGSNPITTPPVAPVEPPPVPAAPEALAVPAAPEALAVPAVPIPAFLLPPEAQQSAQVAQVLPAPAALPEAPAAQALPASPSPSVLETMEAAVRAMVAKANP